MKRTFDLRRLDAYEIIEERLISDLNSDAYLLRHKKTNARIALLSNDDENKVFYIGFRTPPKDSTGVAHIVEHTVLCGSKEFPLKDPFVELVRGSLNTFLNAMTYPDKTVYPVASCNDADFRNLMHVYLDAVFYPNIYREEKIFRQEGWHYELNAPEDELTINGVVYNEMKGAFSAPDEVLSRYVKNSLFPDTTYGLESGGDPECIPDLTYEDYLEFHRRYYHPSNSYIYLYGDMDMAEQLAFIDENYLSGFDAIEVDSVVGMQQAFDAPKEIVKTYSCLEEADEQNATFLTYNAKIGDALDPKLYIAFEALDYALCSSPGAVVKKALIEKGIGEDVFSSFESGILQPFFSIVSRNANAEQKEEFVATIREVLADQVKNGIDKKALKAALNSGEFQYREADYGRFPRGLAYGLQMLDSWLYDDAQPFLHIEALDTFAALNEAVEGRYFEELVKTYLLDNPHRTVLTLSPVAHLSEEKEAALKAQLAAYKDSLSESEIRRIVEETKALRAYQEEEDSVEDIAKIPLLRREDLRTTADPFVYEEQKVDDVTLLCHNIDTSGISYLTFSFDLSNVPDHLFSYLGILKNVLGMMDTAHHSYTDLNNEINILTGGISAGVNTYADASDPSVFATRFEVNVKALYSHLSDAFALVKEILTTTVFDDTARLKEILDECKVAASAALPAAGHQTAALRAMSAFSPQAAVAERISGISAYRLLEEEATTFDDESARRLIHKLKDLSEVIFRKDHLMVDYTALDTLRDGLEDEVRSFAAALFTNPVTVGEPEWEKRNKKEAFLTAGQVQYVCRAGNFRAKGLPFHGGLRALKVILGYDYLWNNIRVKGGAYGCMSGYARNGDSYFVTYRDPHLQRSIDVFEKASEYVRNFEADDRQLLKYIIGALSELDMPKTPLQKGMYGMAAYLCHTPYEQLQQERDELMGITEEVIRKFAAYIDAFLSEDCLCTIGSAAKVDACKDLFDHVEPLTGGTA